MSVTVKPPAERRFSLGPGLTHNSLACAFRHRDPTRTDRLMISQVSAALDRRGLDTRHRHAGPCASPVTPNRRGSAWGGFPPASTSKRRHR